MIYSQLAQKIIKQDLAHQTSIVKKVDTENITKASQRRNPPKSVCTTSEPVATPSPQAKLVGQPQLMQSSQVPAPATHTTSTVRPTALTSIAGVPQVGRVQARATLAARLASPQLITMQPGVNPSSRVRCTLAQGHRLPQSALMQTVLSQTARAKLGHALGAHAQPVLIQSSSAPNTIATSQTSAILKTTISSTASSQTLSHVPRTQLSQAVVGSGQQVFLQASPRSKMVGSGQALPTGGSGASQPTIPQVTAVLANISHNRKSPVQSTHAILSPVNVGQRPTLLTTARPGAGHIVQRSISMPESGCVAPQTIQLLTPQPRIPLAGQRITTSQVNLPINIGKPVVTVPKQTLDASSDKQELPTSLPQMSAACLPSQLQYVKVSQPISVPSATDVLDKHQGLNSPLTLNSGKV